MWILSCAQLTNTCSKLATKKKINLLNKFKVKDNIAWHSSRVFIVDFDYSQHVNIVFLLLTLNKYLSVGQVIIFQKHKKRHNCFVIKVARPISFSYLSLHWTEIIFEQITLLWTYYEHNINKCFSYKIALGNPSVLKSFLPVFWSTLSYFPDI